MSVAKGFLQTVLVAFILGLESAKIPLNTKPAQPFKINQFVRTKKHRIQNCQRSLK